MWSLGTEKPRFVGVRGCLLGDREDISSRRPMWHPIQAPCSDSLCPGPLSFPLLSFLSIPNPLPFFSSSSSTFPCPPFIFLVSLFFLPFVLLSPFSPYLSFPSYLPLFILVPYTVLFVCEYVSVRMPFPVIVPVFMACLYVSLMKTSLGYSDICLSGGSAAFVKC